MLGGILKMKISLITVCFNSAETLRTALDSVFTQRLPPGLELEYLVIDGGSSDGTLSILEEYAEKENGKVKSEKGDGGYPFSFRYISEPDKGMYDAMNKGIKLSTGDFIGILNADDVLASDDVLSRIVSAFTSDPTLDGTYADIRFVKDDAQISDDSRLSSAPEGGGAPSEGAESPSEGGAVFSGGSRGGAFRPEATPSALQALRNRPTTRYCTGRFFRPWMFRFGVQTAHPSTFFRRSCFDRWGLYSLNYGMFADFDLLLRFIWKNRARMRYLPLCTTVMRSGGASTNGWQSTKKINRTDLRALKANGCWSCYLFLYARYPLKVWGYVFKKGRRT